MYNKLTKTAESAISHAVKHAKKMGHTYVGTEHLLLGLLSEKGCIAAKILVSRGIESGTVSDMIEEAVGFGEVTDISSKDMSPRAKTVINNASCEAMKYSSPCIGTEHILLSLMTESDSTAYRIISAHGAKLSELYTDIMAFIDSGNSDKNVFTKEKKTKAYLKDMPTIKQYGKNLNEEALKGKFDPVIGREEEMQRVIQILSRRNKNNPCLIGKAGVGKTAIAEGLALKIVNGEVPSDLENRVIFSVDMSAMLAGAKYRGEFEDRMKNIISEVAKNPCVILFIDELHTIVGAGAAEGAIDAANILKPALARGEMQIIGASTPDEYRKSVEKDSALERRFQPVDVPEPSKEKAYDILCGIRERYEQHHRVAISDGAMRAAVELSEKFITDRCFPDKAIDLIDEACSRKKVALFEFPEDILNGEKELKKLSEEKESAIRNQEFDRACRIREKEKKLLNILNEKKNTVLRERESGNLTVTPDDIASVITGITKIPTGRLLEGEGEFLRTLEEKLNEKIIGQSDAVASVCRAVMRARVGIKDPSRPCSFIFSGPTGVGKTMLCRELARLMFSNDRSYIKLDMSEYMESHSVSRMIGAPPGYSGYEEGGRLTEAVRRQPYSVVVFDEIEKAHKDVFNILLQILDEGRLTDGCGAEVSFKNCIVIMTSNVGFENLGREINFGFLSEKSNKTDEKSLNEKTNSALKKLFTSELLNRVDETVVFRFLTRDDGRKIAEKMLYELQKRCTEAGCFLSFSPDVSSYIADMGCGREYGARNLRRVIRKQIEDVISFKLLNEKINGNCKLNVDVTDGELVFLGDTESDLAISSLKY